MKRLLQKLLLKPVLWASARFASRPDRSRIFPALDRLYAGIRTEPGKRGRLLPFDAARDKFIIFSDQHKGARNGADDFTLCEPNYLFALDWYYKEDFFYINLGDSEELWENMLGPVKEKNKATFEVEQRFLAQKRFIKIFGNHDLYWDNDPIAWWQLRKIYGEEVKVYEGVTLTTTIGQQPLDIFCAHGHQGDASSDGNWFSKFFIARIWAPLQGYLRINPNTPAYDREKKTLHNSIMYDWSARQKNAILVTGHTHQPVFASLTHLERLYKNYQHALGRKDENEAAAVRKEIVKREKDFAAVSVDYLHLLPSYFNTGCCCFSDGDITGIEIASGEIRLVKWKRNGDLSERQVLEAMPLTQLVLPSHSHTV